MLRPSETPDESGNYNHSVRVTCRLGINIRLTQLALIPICEGSKELIVTTMAIRSPDRDLVSRAKFAPTEGAQLIARLQTELRSPYL